MTICQLEHQLQAELHFAWIQCSSGLARCSSRYAVVRSTTIHCQQEIGRLNVLNEFASNFKWKRSVSVNTLLASYRHTIGLDQQSCCGPCCRCKRDRAPSARAIRRRQSSPLAQPVPNVYPEPPTPAVHHPLAHVLSEIICWIEVFGRSLLPVCRLKSPPVLMQFGASASAPWKSARTQGFSSLFDQVGGIAVQSEWHPVPPVGMPSAVVRPAP